MAIPTSHRPWPKATDHCFVAIGQMLGQSALCLVGRPFIWSIWHFWLAAHCASTFGRYFVPAVLAGTHFAPPPYTCMEGFHSCLACFVSFARVILYKVRPSPPSSRVTKKEFQRSGLGVGFVYHPSLYLSLFLPLCVYKCVCVLLLCINT